MHHDHLADAHRHTHVFLADSHDAHARRTRYVVALTAATMVVEVVAGWLTGSMALLADGFHMATHAGALGVAAWAYGYARKHAHDDRFAFGTGKVGDLAGFASALLLAMIALGIGVESVGRLFEPAAIAYRDAIAVAVLGLIVNLASARLLGHDHDHGHAHHRDRADLAHDDGRPGHAHDHGRGHDNNLRSAYFHVLADALTSLLAIVALLAGRYLGWAWMDAAMGIVGALVISRWSWSLLKDTAAVLVDAAGNPPLTQAIRAAIEDGDARVTDLHVWRVGPGKCAAIVALLAAEPLSPTAYAARVRIHRELAHLTIEVHRCDGVHRSLRRIVA